MGKAQTRTSTHELHEDLLDNLHGTHSDMQVCYEEDSFSGRNNTPHPCCHQHDQFNVQHH